MLPTTPLMVTSDFTVCSIATVGLVTVQLEQVPAEVCTVLAIVVVPPGSGSVTVTVKPTLALDAAATVTACVHVPLVHVQPWPVPV